MVDNAKNLNLQSSYLNSHIMRNLFFIIGFFPILLFGQNNFETDTHKTSMGDLRISFIGHGTLMFEVGETTIHIDPVMREADYTIMPDADLILITHHHGDHLDLTAIQHINKENTKLIMPPKCYELVKEPWNIEVLKNGEKTLAGGILIEAIPAYNIIHKRSGGEVFHPKGDGNGYILSIGNTRIFVAGDTENTPEMANLKNIDIAFLPMNLPYTMTPEMVADAARAFRPGILYPYHYGSSDVNELIGFLKDEKDIEVRILRKN